MEILVREQAEEVKQYDLTVLMKMDQKVSDQQQMLEKAGGIQLEISYFDLI